MQQRDDGEGYGKLELLKRQAEQYGLEQRLAHLERRFDGQKDPHESITTKIREVKGELSSTLKWAFGILATVLIAVCAGMFVLFSSLIDKNEAMQTKRMEVINGKFSNVNERIDLYHKKGQPNE